MMPATTIRLTGKEFARKRLHLIYGGQWRCIAGLHADSIIYEGSYGGVTARLTLKDGGDYKIASVTTSAGRTTYITIAIG